MHPGMAGSNLELPSSKREVLWSLIVCGSLKCGGPSDAAGDSSDIATMEVRAKNTGLEPPESHSLVVAVAVRASHRPGTCPGEPVSSLRSPGETSVTVSDGSRRAGSPLHSEPNQETDSGGADLVNPAGECGDDLPLFPVSVEWGCCCSRASRNASNLNRTRSSAESKSKRE